MSLIRFGEHLSRSRSPANYMNIVWLLHKIRFIKSNQIEFIVLLILFRRFTYISNISPDHCGSIFAGTYNIDIAGALSILFISLFF